MEEIILDAKEEVVEKGSGCGQELAWFGASFTLPLGNKTFIKKGMKQQARKAVLFFFVLMSCVTVLQMIVMMNSFGIFLTEIENAYIDGDVPTLIIEDGIASLEGRDSFILVDQDGAFIGIDTSGEITEIDRTYYYQGFLLTRTELHMLNDGEYQVIPLDEMGGQERFVIDQELVQKWMSTLFGIMFLSMFIFLGFYHTIIRFMYLVGIGLLIWGIMGIAKKDFNFSEILISGIYTFLPALVIRYVLELNGIQIFFLPTVLHAGIWFSVLFSYQKDRKKGKMRDIIFQPWQTLIGLPLLIGVIFTYVFEWDTLSFPLLLLAALTIFIIYYLDKMKIGRNIL